MWNKQRYCWQFPNHVWIAEFLQVATEIITMLWKSEYFFVVLWHGRSCKEMCRNDVVSWLTKRRNNSTKYLLHASMTITSREEEMKSVGELSKVCSRNVFKKLKLGTHWMTWYSMVSEQTCTIDHKMDQSLWQTPESIDLLHSSHMWITNNIVMFETLQNNADWDWFKTPILHEILRTQNPLLEEHCAFLEVIHLFQ